MNKPAWALRELQIRLMSNRSHTFSATGSSDSIGTLGFESTAALAKRIAQQDTRAFAVLVDRYHEFVFRICFGILRHRQDAEDATQDTFSRVARYLDRWDTKRPFEPWLATVAGNRSRTQLSRRRNYAPLTSAAEPESYSTPQAHAAYAMREEILLAMASLPQRQRIAFEYFHEHSMSYIEIAEKMDCPLGTVKTLVHRARQALIEHLRRREIVTSDSETSANDSVNCPERGDKR